MDHPRFTVSDVPPSQPVLSDQDGESLRSPVSPKRRLRRVSGLAVVLVGPLLLQFCSAYQVNRAQAERSVLGRLLYVESAGPVAGSAIVFLPGMMGTTTYWREAGALSLADHETRVLLLDELGFGRSPWPNGEYTLERHLTAIDGTLTSQRAQDQLILVGHSFGALLAAEYGARHLDSVRQVILFGTPLYRSEAEARLSIGEMSDLAGLTARNGWLARLVCTIHTAFLPLTVRLAPYLRRDIPAAIAADGALHFWPSLQGSVENIVLRHSIEPAAKVLGAKLTFVHGRRDAISPMERVREVAAASGASLIETDTDHLSYWQGAVQVVRERLRRRGMPET